MAGFIKFGDVEGESLDKGHKGWTDLIYYRIGYLKSTGGTGVHRRGGDTRVDDVTVQINLDKAGVKVAEKMLNGHVFPKILIHLTASYTDIGREVYVAYELKHSFIRSIEEAADTDGDGRPEVELKINYEEMKYDYTVTDSKGKKKGNIQYGWKVEEGEK